jgi:hypothetical protein
MTLLTLGDKQSTNALRNHSWLSYAMVDPIEISDKAGKKEIYQAP